MLVTLDGSEFAEQVLPAVKNILADAKAEVTLLSVVAPSELRQRSVGRDFPVQRTLEHVDLTGSPVPLTRPSATATVMNRRETNAKSEREDYLSLIIRREGLQGAAFRVIISKDAAQAVTDYAHKGSFDLIAMATHGRSSLSQAVLGSVATEVLRAGAVPVLLVRPQA